jgi:esterase
MKLFFRKYGEGPPLIIAHGLYGASDNWITVAKELSDKYEVFIIDQRNHGNSPHSDEHNYLLLKNDLLNFMDEQGIKKAILLGHSMGGKTIMYFAADYPERVQALIVVDISPRSYKNPDRPAPHTVNHMNIIQAMMNIDLTKVETRMDIDMMLAETVKSHRVRQFLLKNIKRKDQNNFSWKINLPALQNALHGILDGLDPEKYRKNGGIAGFPVLFIKGADSDYIDDIDIPVINTIFPVAEIVTINNSGHWVHAEQPDLFIKNIKYFLGEDQ